MSKRRLFLVALIILVAALFVAQVAGIDTSADISPGQVQATEASIGENVPVGDPFPNPQHLVDTSPYTHEPLPISSGTGGMNLPK